MKLKLSKLASLLTAVLFLAATAPARSELAPPAPDAVMNLDLHTHTYCSDGGETPETVVGKAAEAGVEFLAVTDHDTMTCVSRAKKEADAKGVRLIAGIEISVGAGSMHVLGLGVDAENAALKALMESADHERIRRAEAIVQKLNDLNAGKPIDFLADLVLTKVNKNRVIDGAEPIGAEAAAEMGREALLSGFTGEITRPDIAQVLVDKGYVADTKEAFSKYIGNDGPAYVPVQGPSFTDVLDIIHNAGGIAVLAHPFTIFKVPADLAKQYADFDALFRALVEAGLDGVEAYQPQTQYTKDNETKLSAALITLPEKARRKLLYVPSSDYHAHEKIGGKNIGGLPMPKEEAAKILRALNIHKPRAAKSAK
ncbi:MAG: PHP domain-containing protein [Elusimicrobia bacterium]|nr:PHP domain-containing protein [Elusimicrobiota bacterium]